MPAFLLHYIILKIREKRFIEEMKTIVCPRSLCIFFHIVSSILCKLDFFDTLYSAYRCLDSLHTASVSCSACFLSTLQNMENPQKQVNRGYFLPKYLRQMLRPLRQGSLVHIHIVSMLLKIDKTS